MPAPTPSLLAANRGGGFPPLPFIIPDASFDDDTHPTPCRAGVYFFSFILFVVVNGRQCRSFILIATNDDEDHPRRQHPSVCAIPSQQVHQRQLTSGVHLRGILYAQTHMGFHTHGTLQTRAREHGNPAPVQMGTGFCGYGRGLGNFCPRVTHAHH